MNDLSGGAIAFCIDGGVQFYFVGIGEKPQGRATRGGQEEGMTDEEIQFVHSGRRVCRKSQIIVNYFYDFALLAGTV